MLILTTSPIKMRAEVLTIESSVGERVLEMESAARMGQPIVAQNIKKNSHSLSGVDRKPEPELDNMAPRADDEFKQALTMMAQAMTIMAQAQSKPVNGKSVADRIKEWFPNVMMIAILVFSVTKYDAVRETKVDTGMVEMKGKVEQIEKRDTERKAEIEMWRTYVTALVIELKSRGLKIPPMPRGE